MHTPQIQFKEHMHTEKTRFQHQIWPQKPGQFPDLQFFPFPIEGWFWGPLIGLRNGASQAFFLLLSYHLGVNIWSAWPQLQRFSVCQTGFTTKTSTCSKYPCAIIIICAQHSLLRLQAYTHTHSEGPQPRSQKCLFLRPQKQACWQFFCAFIYMLSTQLLRLQASTHIERVHGAWFLAKRSLLFWACCVPFRRNTAKHTRQHHLGSGPWLRIWQLNWD